MSMSQPRVSIVTPSLNQGAFIADTISSVLAQDYPGIEYLVVDGGSTDRTLDILRSFGDQVAWVSETDGGQSDAINKGWRMTGGEIVAWLNADDLYRPGAISKVMSFFCEHPDIDLVYGDCDYLNEQGQVVGRHQARSAMGADLLRSSVSIISQPTAFLRRRVLQTVGLLDETLDCVMDFELFLRVASRHQIGYLPECLAAFRVHAGAKSSRLSARLEAERVQVYERFFESTDLPQQLRQVRSEGMSNAYYRLANYHFLRGDMKQARRYVMTGWRQRVWRLHRTQLKVLTLGLAGPRGVQLAAWLKHAPSAKGRRVYE